MNKPELAELSENHIKMRKEYEDSLKAYRDVKNSIDTALEQVSTAIELPLEEIQKMRV